MGLEALDAHLRAAQPDCLRLSAVFIHFDPDLHQRIRIRVWIRVWIKILSTMKDRIHGPAHFYTAFGMLASCRVSLAHEFIEGHRTCRP